MPLGATAGTPSVHPGPGVLAVDLKGCTGGVLAVDLKEG